jgi:hypothetical protein
MIVWEAILKLMQFQYQVQNLNQHKKKVKI